MVFTVAMESRGERAAKEWIEKGNITYVNVIDRNHVVSDLYNMVNVPQGVWIDEQGTIVRPTEVTGASGSRNMDKRKKIRDFYVQALRDWVLQGEQSPYYLTAEEARKRVQTPSADVLLAHAQFHLGQYLWQQGQRSEAAQMLAQAAELNPDSWNMFRQFKNLEHPAGSISQAFYDRVEAFLKQGKEYYPLADLPGYEQHVKGKKESDNP